jgi:glycerol uptake facilitator-like aquaporin
VTLARAATDTFTGIRPADVPGFIVAQVCGATAATALFWWLLPPARDPVPAAVPTAPPTLAGTHEGTITGPSGGA